MRKSKRKILITHALPYANGPLHLGHMVEHVQGDVWARFQRLNGHEVHLICAEDAHGTAIMLKAKSESITPEALIEKVAEDHKQDFLGFNISFDHFYTTHSPENTELAQQIYKRLYAKGFVKTKMVMRAYDETEAMFLPDRFIKGTCPNCKTEDQYGDNCENCGATYASTDLIDAVSVVSGKPPVQKQTEQLFFNLNQFEEFLKDWHSDTNRLQKQARNKLNEWFDAGLKDWEISRDAPYFGIEIPNKKDKYFYVWLDAPIGYMASFKNYCDLNGIDFDSYWNKDSTTQLYHFIGKDILYFHALFWLAMLEGADYRTPSAIFTHGFLTINGQKMSKSRGTFIRAKTYLDFFPADYFRYYIAAKLNAQIEDIDLNFDDFIQRINSDLMGKLVNLAARCSGFINKRFNNQLASKLEDQHQFDEFILSTDKINDYFERREYSRAIRIIMRLADTANKYIDDKKPWQLAKVDDKQDDLQLICSQGLNYFRVLMIYLAPVVPDLARKVEDFLNCPITKAGVFNEINTPLLDHQINKYQHLMKRIELSQVDKMMNAENKQSKSQNKNEDAEKQPLISIDDFLKVDLRVARILDAQHIEGAEKLLQLKVDIGSEKRAVIAGIKSAYEPEALIDRHVVIVANLQPRKMRFGVSEGMILAAGPGGEEIWLISPDSGVQAGMRVK